MPEDYISPLECSAIDGDIAVADALLRPWLQPESLERMARKALPGGIEQLSGCYEIFKPFARRDEKAEQHSSLEYLHPALIEAVEHNRVGWVRHVLGTTLRPRPDIVISLLLKEDVCEFTPLRLAVTECNEQLVALFTDHFQQFKIDQRIIKEHFVDQKSLHSYHEEYVRVCENLVQVLSASSDCTAQASHPGTAGFGRPMSEREHCPANNVLPRQ